MVITGRLPMTPKGSAGVADWPVVVSWLVTRG